MTGEGTGQVGQVMKDAPPPWVPPELSAIPKPYAAGVINANVTRT